MGLVEEVENLSPGLHVDPLGWFEDLVRGKVYIHKVGPRNGVSSQVAIRSRRRPRKGAGIVPQIRSSQRCTLSYIAATRRNSVGGIGAEARVQVGAVRRPPVPVLGSVRSVAPGERFPRTECADSVDGPAAQNGRQRLLLEVKWERIGGSEDKVLSRVKRRSPAARARFRKSIPVFGSWRDSPPAMVDLSSIDLE